MITISAFKWVPPFAQGSVRDLRLRWALKEAGIDYRVQLIDDTVQKSESYRSKQPFGQVPIFDDEGLVLFETGAILLRIGERTPALLPREDATRAHVISWLFASLNSVEPFVMNLAEVDFFIQDQELKRQRRPAVLDMVHLRFGQLQEALDGRDWLVDGFSIADLMMTTVLRGVKHTDILDGYPQLAAYRKRGEDRPAFQAALADQMADFARNAPEA